MQKSNSNNLIKTQRPKQTDETKEESSKAQIHTIIYIHSISFDNLKFKQGAELILQKAGKGGETFNVISGGNCTFKLDDYIYAVYPNGIDVILKCEGLFPDTDIYDWYYDEQNFVREYFLSCDRNNKMNKIIHKVYENIYNYQDVHSATDEKDLIRIYIKYDYYQYEDDEKTCYEYECEAFKSFLSKYTKYPDEPYNKTMDFVNNENNINTLISIYNDIHGEGIRNPGLKMATYDELSIPNILTKNKDKYKYKHMSIQQKRCVNIAMLLEALDSQFNLMYDKTAQKAYFICKEFEIGNIPKSGSLNITLALKIMLRKIALVDLLHGQDDEFNIFRSYYFDEDPHKIPFAALSLIVTIALTIILTMYVIDNLDEVIAQD
eukprot:82655_1